MAPASNTFIGKSAAHEMITATNLSKHYGKTVALRDVSFSIAKGEVVGFLGQNGAGKSTTMRILTTFLPPTSGDATINGKSILRDADSIRGLIGSLPETPPLYPEMTVREYLTFVAQIKHVEKKRLEQSVSQVLEQCSLNNVQNSHCGKLSKGYKQRVGIAQAIVHKPPVIILDEPTSGLDPAQIVEIRALIKSLGEHHTVILSTHILQEVIEICSRVIMIHRGGVVLDGSLSEVTKDNSLEARFLSLVRSDGMEFSQRAE